MVVKQLFVKTAQCLIDRKVNYEKILNETDAMGQNGC
jgi:hypothetical protein